MQVKLRRLLRYMKFRDIKAAVSRNTSVDDDDPTEHGKLSNMPTSVLSLFHMSKIAT